MADIFVTLIEDYLPEVEDYTKLFYQGLVGIGALSFIWSVLTRKSFDKTKPYSRAWYNFGFSKKAYQVLLLLFSLIANSLLCSVLLALMVSRLVDLEEMASASLFDIFKEMTTIIVQNWRDVPFALFIFQFFVMRRFFETLFIAEYSKRPVPWYIELFQFAIQFMTSVMYCLSDTRKLLGYADRNLTKELLSGLLFLVFNYCQNHCVMMLANIRYRHRYNTKKDDDAKKKPENAPVYGLPMRGFFNFVVCPHYLFEILIYFSLYICCMESKLPLIHLGYLALVLSGAALKHYSWYKRNYPKYTEGRKALIPFVF